MRTDRLISEISKRLDYTLLQKYIQERRENDAVTYGLNIEDYNALPTFPHYISAWAVTLTIYIYIYIYNGWKSGARVLVCPPCSFTPVRYFPWEYCTCKGGTMRWSSAISQYMWYGNDGYMGVSGVLPHFHRNWDKCNIPTIANTEACLSNLLDNNTSSNLWHHYEKITLLKQSSALLGHPTYANCK